MSDRKLLFTYGFTTGFIIGIVIMLLFVAFELKGSEEYMSLEYEDRVCIDEQVELICDNYIYKIGDVYCYKEVNPFRKQNSNDCIEVIDIKGEFIQYKYLDQHGGVSSSHCFWLSVYRK